MERVASQLAPQFTTNNQQIENYEHNYQAGNIGQSITSQLALTYNQQSTTENYEHSHQTGNIDQSIELALCHEAI
jgi:hypothetical protein